MKQLLRDGFIEHSQDLLDGFGIERDLGLNCFFLRKSEGEESIADFFHAQETSLVNDNRSF